MNGRRVAEYTFKKKEEAVTLGMQSSITIEGEMVHIDPQLLFQCIIIAANTTNDIEGIFKHELCIHPPALFDSHLLMREPQKSVLADAIWEKVSSGFTPPKVKSVMY